MPSRGQLGHAEIGETRRGAELLDARPGESLVESAARLGEADPARADVDDADGLRPPPSHVQQHAVRTVLQQLERADGLLCWSPLHGMERSAPADTRLAGQEGLEVEVPPCDGCSLCSVHADEVSLLAQHFSFWSCR